MQTNVIHGTGIAFLGTTMTVSAPVFVGDTIQVAWTVTEARPTSKGNRGIVTTRNLVRRQDGQIVMEYSPTRMIAGPAAGRAGQRRESLVTPIDTAASEYGAPFWAGCERGELLVRAMRGLRQAHLPARAGLPGMPRLRPDVDREQAHGHRLLVQHRAPVAGPGRTRHPTCWP